MAQTDLFTLPPRPWNAGRLVGAKAPLKPKHICGIRQQLPPVCKPQGPKPLIVGDVQKGLRPNLIGASEMSGRHEALAVENDLQFRFRIQPVGDPEDFAGRLGRDPRSRGHHPDSHLRHVAANSIPRVSDTSTPEAR